MNFVGSETSRAVENFPLSGERADSVLIKSLAMVKQACCRTNKHLGYLCPDVADAVDKACEEMKAGKYDHDIVIDAYQGGAGTSLNMNVNEVLAHYASEASGEKVEPLAHVNLHQSTNDVFPTAVRVAVLLYLKGLETVTGNLQEALQGKEKEFAAIVKLGRTEMMDAVPMTLGMEFGAYAEALARDRWRIFKCRERIKTVNLGGTAIGTGLGAPRDYILQVNETLKRITGLSVSRSENLVDATQNMDAFVEVSGMLKALAVNLLKISNDLRLLASGPDGGLAEIKLPALQKGSSIMPGKVNPVIPEAVSQVALQVMHNDGLIAMCAGMGNLELNHYLPLLAHTLLKSLKLLTNAAVVLNEKCIIGIRADVEQCMKHLLQSKTIATYLIPMFGYSAMEEVIKEAMEQNSTVKEVMIRKEMVSVEQFDKLLAPGRMYKLGFTPDDYQA